MLYRFRKKVLSLGDRWMICQKMNTTKIIYWASILITIIGGKAAEGEEGEGAGGGGEEENEKKKKKKKEMDGK